MTNEKKTIRQWEEHFDTMIMDFDGFPEDIYLSESVFTEKEFLENARLSTVRFSEKLLEAFKNLQE